MRAPPPVSRFTSYPATGGVAALAIAVSVGWWMHQIPVERLEMSPAVWRGEPWRLWTSALPHVNALHLAFDVYWLWVFGTLIEETWGSLATLGAYLFLAAGSAAAEWAFSGGGVGLSGVGYGLFGLLWVLSRRTQRFAGAIDGKTIQVFVVWFFLCIAFTVMNILPVGNVAHGSGAILGALLGFAITARPAPRIAWGTATVVLLAGIGLCASVLRPRVNFSKSGGYDEFQLGYEALTAGRNEEAEMHLRRSVAYRRAPATYWYDLGIAEDRLGHSAEAAAAFHRAAELEPGSATYQAAAHQSQQK
jgi:membrane associated rhomboid family serine protease